MALEILTAERVRGWTLPRV